MTILWCVLWNHTFQLATPIFNAYLYLQSIKK